MNTLEMGDQHTKNINNDGGYNLDDVIWHAYSPRLMKKIIELFPKETMVLDIGCGLNNYVNILSSIGYKAIGFDFVDLGSNNFKQFNVTKPLPKINEVANVISLEVGEHIPSELSEAFLDNLTKFGGDIIMSWAVPGQAGIGHINCQTNQWVINEMNKRWYEIDLSLTQNLRESVKDCHCTWFINTLMYFKKM